MHNFLSCLENLLSKKTLVESFGATHVDYRNEDFVERSLALTDRGMDVIFDTIGGKNWGRSYQALAKGGVLIAFGALQVTSGEEKIPSLLWGFAKLLGLWKLLPDGKDSTFYNIHTRRGKLPNEFKQDVQALFQLLKEAKLKPAIAARLPLDQAAEAHRRIDNADVQGKIILMIDHNH